MRIGIIGTGAVGGFFGAKLKLAGFDVVFLSRGKTLEALKKNGLRLETAGKIYTIKDTIFTDNPKELGSLDYILFTVKSYDTKNTTKQIKDIISKDTILITPQNGIDNDILIGKVIGKKKVIPAMVQIGVSTLERGHIKHTGLGMIKFGEYDGNYSNRVKKFEGILKKSNIDYIVSNQIQTERWKKYIWNCTFNIIAAITGLRCDQILADSFLKQLCTDTINEIKEIALKEGISFGNENVVGKRMELAEKLGKFKPSTLEDLEKGKKIELDAFTGTIISLSKKHGLTAPINSVLYALLDGIINGRK